VEGLVTDIGGTNARIAIAEGLELKTVRVYPTRQFQGAIELFRQFQADIGRPLPKRWAVGAAGVTSPERIHGTNIGWDIVRDELVSTFGLELCILLNDFEIAAYGLATLGRDQLVELGGASAKASAPRIILGAGTGLGEATCVLCPGSKWHVLKSEGGHASLAPTDETEIRLLKFLQQRFGHVSYERVLSGQGILSLYEFFLSESGQKESVPTFDDPSQVTKAALEGEPLSLKAVELFCRIYGEEAGNFALKTLPFGGVFLSGGIVLHILPILQKGLFRKGFESKGRMKEILRNIPVFVVKEPYLGLYGGAYRLLQES